MATSLMHALYLSCLPNVFPSALVSEALSCLRSTPRTNGLTWGSIKAQLTQFKEFTNKDLWVLVLIWLSSGIKTHPMVHIYNTKQTKPYSEALMENEFSSVCPCGDPWSWLFWGHSHACKSWYPSSGNMICVQATHCSVSGGSVMAFHPRMGVGLTMTLRMIVIIVKIRLRHHFGPCCL